MEALYPAIPSNNNCFVCEREAVYAPRHAEEIILYGVVAENLETFLARQEQRDRTVPRFVEREFRSFLDCGIHAHGFLRVHCDECGQDLLVPFSCKGRGFCESCCARRMSDTAAHLVDRVFPDVPVRQWVLTLPYPLRFHMAYDSKLVAAIHRIFVQTVFGFLRKKAGDGRKLKCGAVTFIQRFGDALNLNVHDHLLAIDGVYSQNEKGDICFQPAAPPNDKEVVKVAERIAKRIERLMIRLGMTSSGSEKDAEFADKQPLLAELYGASVAGKVATGPKAGKPLTKIGDDVDLEEMGYIAGPRCANVAGVNVHSNVLIPSHDNLFIPA
jgi:hypothetical protein